MTEPDPIKDYLAKALVEAAEKGGVLMRGDGGEMTHTQPEHVGARSYCGCETRGESKLIAALKLEIDQAVAEKRMEAYLCGLAKSFGNYPEELAYNLASEFEVTIERALAVVLRKVQDGGLVPDPSGRLWHVASV